MKITVCALLVFTLGSAVLADETNLTLTVDGIIYSNVTFGTVTPATVVIRHSTGAATLPLAKLPADLQQRLGHGASGTATNRVPDQPSITADLNAFRQGEILDDLKATKCFVVACSTRGAPATEAFGEDKPFSDEANVLRDFIQLKLKSNLGKIPIKSFSEFAAMTGSELDGVTICYVTVDTVGAGDYPIAYNVSLEVRARWTRQTYAVSSIGICNRRQLEGAVKLATTQLVEQFAVSLMTVRGKY